MKKIKLIAAILICEGVGILGSLFTAPSIPTWYKSLNRPTFSPPNWVFAPVWTLLFLLMAISAYLVWNKGLKKTQVREAMYVFIFQLLLNFFWSFFFFGIRQPYLAFLEIIALWLAILLTIIKFYKISKAASYLLIPYILWVSFAAVLNLSIVLLNK